MILVFFWLFLGLVISSLITRILEKCAISVRIGIAGLSILLGPLAVFIFIAVLFWEATV